MKYTTCLAAFLLLFSTVLFSNCTADRGSVSTPREIIAQGSWGIRSLMVAGGPSDQYSDYSFTFSPSGAVAIRTTAGQTSGNWQWVRNVQSEVLDLHLPDHSGLEALNDQWTLEQWSLSSLTLKRGTDRLVLQQLSMP